MKHLPPRPYHRIITISIVLCRFQFSELEMNMQLFSLSSYFFLEIFKLVKRERMLPFLRFGPPGRYKVYKDNCRMLKNLSRFICSQPSDTGAGDVGGYHRGPAGPSGRLHPSVCSCCFSGEDETCSFIACYRLNFVIDVNVHCKEQPFFCYLQVLTLIIT